MKYVQMSAEPATSQAIMRVFGVHGCSKTPEKAFFVNRYASQRAKKSWPNERMDTTKRAVVCTGVVVNAKITTELRDTYENATTLVSNFAHST